MKYIYRTMFNLTNPVNDFDAAQDYLTDDDMSVYLKDSLDDSDIQEDWVESIEWNLSDEQSGTITLITTQELTQKQLDFISDWVRGQCSDGIGEGFEQQEFAAIYDVDEWGDPDESTWDMASFDWETNPYKFTLVKKVNESVIKESKEEKCCENCRFYVYDFSTGQAICNCPKDGEWVRQKEEDIWTVDYDFCDQWEQALDESTGTSDGELGFGFMFGFEDELSSGECLSATRNWLEGLKLDGFKQYLKKFPVDQILFSKIHSVTETGFKFVVYLKDITLMYSTELHRELADAVERYVFDEIVPYYNNQPFGKIVKDRKIVYLPVKNGVTESVIIEADDPTEGLPLKIDAPRGAYWVWKTGSTIYGSAEKPDPTKNIVNARSIINFTDQGFDTIDEVIEYVKKYF